MISYDEFANSPMWGIVTTTETIKVQAGINRIEEVTLYLTRHGFSDFTIGYPIDPLSGRISDTRLIAVTASRQIKITDFRPDKDNNVQST